MISIFAVFILASAILILSISKAQTWGLVDKPSDRKFQTTPIPRLGGLSFYLPFLLSSFFLKSSWSWALIMGATIIFIGGLYDDLGKVHRARTKIIFQLAGCGVFALFFPLTNISTDVNLSARFAVGAILFAMVNSFNLMDNMNGLTSGLSLILLLGISILTKSETLQNSLILCSVAIVPFFLTNFLTGNVFMGDQGSQLLGFIIPSFFFEIFLSQAQLDSYSSLLKPLLVLICFLFLFIADTCLVIVLRLREGRSIFLGDQSHISHQLLKLGLTKASVAYFLFIVQSTLIYFGLKLFIL